MRLDLSDAIQILSRTPGILRTLLGGLRDDWIFGNYGLDTFSPFDVVGHLITGERTDWPVRIRFVLDQGTSQPFPTYDRYAQFEQSRGKSIADLLDEFEQRRSSNLETLRGLRLTAADLEKRGLHPALGEVTLSQLLATWVAHDLNHLAQIAKAMATQYADEVGPWKQYLGILRSPATAMDAQGAERRRAAGG